MKVYHKSNKHDWRTPPELFEKINKIMRFTLDFAASAENALCEKFYDDALGQEPDPNEVIWCNPPYGRMLPKFLKRLSELPNASVALVPARTDTSYWFKYIWPRANIVFLSGRVKFVGAEHGAPFGSALVFYETEKELVLNCAKAVKGVLR